MYTAACPAVIASSAYASRRLNYGGVSSPARNTGCLRTRRRRRSRPARRQVPARTPPRRAELARPRRRSAQRPRSGSGPDSDARTAQPERTRTFCDSPERVEVAEIRDRADEAEREAPGRDGGDHDLEARDRASLSACLHPRRDREVARAQPDRDDAGMRAGDLRRVQQAFRPFDPRKEERVAEGQAALLLYCGGHLGEREHVLRGVDLRQDERADILVHRGLDVTDRETPRPVDPHEHVDIALDDLGGRLADEPAGAIFLRRRDGVLELEDHGTGAALVRLRDELFRDDRDVEQRAPARRHTTPSASSFASPPAEIPSSA